MGMAAQFSAAQERTSGYTTNQGSGQVTITKIYNTEVESAASNNKRTEFAL